MDEAVVIVLHDHRADPVASAAVAHIQRLTQIGVARPFWSVDQEDTRRAEYADVDGVVDVDLLSSIANVPHPRVGRIVTIASAALDAAAIPRLASAANRLGDDVRRYAPAGVPVVDVRVISPEDLVHETPLTDLLSACAEANIVLVPEDRASDACFAEPVGLDDVESFAGHVATELATLGGLWVGMDASLVDDRRAGVIDNGDAAVVFSRSMVRLAVGPSLPVHEAVGAGAMLPVPRGTEPAPDAAPCRACLREPALRQRRGAALSSARTVRHQSRTGRRPGRDGSVAPRVGDYVRHLPRQLRRGVVADFEQVAGEAVTNALGTDSSLQVVWPGKTADDVPTTAPVDLGRAPRPVRGAQPHQGATDLRPAPLVGSGRRRPVGRRRRPNFRRHASSYARRATSRHRRSRRHRS